MGYSRASRNQIYGAIGRNDLVATTKSAVVNTGKAIKLAGDMSKAFVRNTAGQDVTAILGNK